MTINQIILILFITFTLSACSTDADFTDEALGCTLNCLDSVEQYNVIH